MVLSPHRDDAAFSLCICLAKWSALPVRLRVVNFFTRSGYAPWGDHQTPDEISAARRREDRAALRCIHPQIRVSDKTFVDAPLRTGVPVSSVCDPASSSYITDDLIAQIERALRCYRTDLVLAPLTLGDHMDHVAVHRAACRVFPARLMGFYEDLPYAMWTPRELREQKVNAAAGAMGTPLRPVTISSPQLARKKYGVIQRYRSQITSAEARAMSQWSRKFHSGERIWVPVRSNAWRRFI